jgi:hypothetical protein
MNEDPGRPDAPEPRVGEPLLGADRARIDSDKLLRYALDPGSTTSPSAAFNDAKEATKLCV